MLQLAGEVTHQSRMQVLFEDIWSMEGGHVQGGAGGVIDGGIPLSMEGVGDHVRWGRALLIIPPLGAFVIERQGQAFPFLPAVAEPHTHNLSKDTTHTHRLTHIAPHIQQCTVMKDLLLLLKRNNCNLTLKRTTTLKTQ